MYMSTIIVHNEHKLNGRASGLLILTRLAGSMLQLTTHRMEALLSSMFKPIKRHVGTYHGKVKGDGGKNRSGHGSVRSHDTNAFYG